MPVVEQDGRARAGEDGRDVADEELTPQGGHDGDGDGRRRRHHPGGTFDVVIEDAEGVADEDEPGGGEHEVDELVHEVDADSEREEDAGRRQLEDEKAGREPARSLLFRRDHLVAGAEVADERDQGGDDCEGSEPKCRQLGRVTVHDRQRLTARPERPNVRGVSDQHL